MSSRREEVMTRRAGIRPQLQVSHSLSEAVQRPLKLLFQFQPKGSLKRSGIGISSYEHQLQISPELLCWTEQLVESLREPPIGDGKVNLIGPYYRCNRTFLCFWIVSLFMKAA